MRGPERFDQAALSNIQGREGLDAVIALSPENVYYTSGTLIATQKLIRDRLAFVVLPKDGEPTLIVAIMEESLSRAESWIRDVRSYVEHAETPLAVLARVLEEKGLTRGAVGIELSFLSGAHYLELTRTLPNLDWVACENLFWELRMVKSPQEFEHLARIARVTERAIAKGFATARPYSTERAIAAAMREQSLAEGADDIALCVLASGARGIHAHPTPDDTPVQPGDLIRVDFCGVFDGYYSDLQRMAVVGKPSTHQVDTYARVYEAQRRVIEKMQPGVRACEVFQCAREAYEQNGLLLDEPHIGHGLGLSLHEPPVLEPHNTMELQPGMVLAVEPDFIEKDTACYALEDVVHITNSGAMLLSDALPADLYIIA
jgi:Xaa-Pro dipeptidase